MKNKNKIILDYSLAFLIVVFSIFLWRIIDQTKSVSEVSSWILPIILFSLALIFFELLIVSSRQRLLIQIVAGFLTFSSLFFIFDFIYLIILGISYLFLTLSISKIRNDLNLRIKINFYRSVRIGMIFFIFALTLSISSHYFFQTRNNRLEKIAPKLNISWIVEKVAPKILGSVNQDFKGLEEKDLTVNQWILETEKDNIEKFSITRNSIEEKLILERGALQLEELSGIEIKGNEKMKDIINQMIENKVDEFLVADYAKGSFPAIPFVFSFILFLTLFSLGTILYPLLTGIAGIIFWIFRKMKLVKIIDELRDVERIQ